MAGVAVSDQGTEGDPVRLHELLRSLPVRLPDENPEVKGLQHDSRKVATGDLFVAMVGERFDGRRFAADAARRGAVAVLGPDPAPRRLPVPWIGARDPRSLLGVLAGRLYHRPDERLLLAGVTGTNGKTTVVRLLAAILDAAGRPTGTGGTLGYCFGGREILPVARTTPEAPDLYRALAEMSTAGAEAVVMEVSSHGLALQRVAGLRLDLGLFTNLSRDHLDFHGDLESYFAAKKQLFQHLKPTGWAVVATDDDWGRRLARELPVRLGARVWTCGTTAGGKEDVRLLAADLDLEGIRARCATPRGELELTSPLVGRFNLQNLLVAVAGAEALGLDQDAIRRGVAAVSPLAGRLEPVRCGQDFPVFVDFAHTPAALAAVLGSLRELSDRKVAVVFGCGGDRDPGKREAMGQLASELADLAVATSDNPRGEDPEAILDQVQAGLERSGRRNWWRTAERRDAIRRAVAAAVADLEGSGWVVLVAGKGHETGQIVRDEVLPFSDHQELSAALARHGFHGPQGEGS